MKKLSIFGIITCVGLLLAPAAVIGEGPPTFDVNVVNIPVPVTTQIEPVNFILELEIASGEAEVYIVPEGKLLVIEDATVSATVNPEQRLVAYINTTAGGVNASHYVGKLDGASFSSFSSQSDGRTMRVYADPGTEVRITASSLNIPTNVTIRFSGRLEP